MLLLLGDHTRRRPRTEWCGGAGARRRALRSVVIMADQGLSRRQWGSRAGAWGRRGLYGFGSASITEDVAAAISRSSSQANEFSNRIKRLPNNSTAAERDSGIPRFWLS